MIILLSLTAVGWLGLSFYAVGDGDTDLARHALQMAFLTTIFAQLESIHKKLKD